MEHQVLEKCCDALGWQGSTIHQVIEVLKRVKELKGIYFSGEEKLFNCKLEKLFREI